jgi:hypothetical protein
MSEFKRLPGVETITAQEVLATDVRVEGCGTFTRMIFAVPEKSVAHNESRRLTVVEKVILPPNAISELINSLANPTEIRPARPTQIWAAN